MVCFDGPERPALHAHLLHRLWEQAANLAVVAHRAMWHARWELQVQLGGSRPPLHWIHPTPIQERRVLDTRIDPAQPSLVVMPMSQPPKFGPWPFVHHALSRPDHNRKHDRHVNQEYHQAYAVCTSTRGDAIVGINGIGDAPALCVLLVRLAVLVEVLLRHVLDILAIWLLIVIVLLRGHAIAVIGPIATVVCGATRIARIGAVTATVRVTARHPTPDGLGGACCGREA
mmetsp:Transcript_39285/g.113603  ORF Transcript_39285/g.113603 Transcript_39285/m.113603 type:complete len:229 (-) Transcript_39285:11-697(-)